MRKVLIFLFVFIPMILRGQYLINEGFVGLFGNSINTIGWNTDCGSGSDIQISPAGLTYANYIGGSDDTYRAAIQNQGGSNGISYSKNFGSGGLVYVSFLINVTSAPNGFPFSSGCSTGTPAIVAFGGGGGSSNDTGFVVLDNFGSYRMGLLSNCCGNGSGFTNFAYGVTYLIVMKSTGSQVSLYVNPSLGTPESFSPEVTVGTSGGSNSALYLSNRAQADLSLDGILVSNNYDALVATAPTVGATINSITNITENSMQVNITNGSGNGRIVVAKQGSPVDAFPMDGVNYASSAIFGTGSEIGSGNYVIDEPCCGVTLVSGLQPNTPYYYEVFEYNDNFGVRLYNTFLNVANATTLATEPGVQAHSLVFNSVTTNSMNVSWTNGSGTERLVLAKQFGVPVQQPVDGTAYTGNANFSAAIDVGGGERVVYRGSGNSVTVTNLSPSAEYFYRVFELNGAGITTNYNISGAFGNPMPRWTLTTEPIGQPTSILFSNNTVNSQSISFTPSAASGYLVLRKAISSPTDIPVDGVNYAVGNTIGTSTVVSASPSIFIISSGLAPSTVYYYDIFAYNEVGLGSINYRTGGPLEGSLPTLFPEPTIQASNVLFASPTTTSINLSWTIGNGTSRIVVAKAGSAVLTNPVDGTSYAANSVFGTGAQTGGAEYVVYNGVGTNVSVTGLSPGSVYHFRVYEYNGSGLQINYFSNTGTGNPANRYTLDLEPSAHPASFTASSISSSQINLSFSAANTLTDADGYIILRRQDGANPDATGVTDGLAPGSLPLPVGTTLVTTISITSTSTFSNTSLGSGTNYNYAIIPYNQNGASNETYNYLTSATIRTSASFTTAVDPTTQPSLLTFNSPTSAGYTVGYTAATGSPSGYLAIRRLASSPTGIPVDGTAYTVGMSIGDGVVAYSGSNLSFNETTLGAATVYHYDIFSYNGSGVFINYLTTSPLEGSRTTLSTEPVAQPTALIFSGTTSTSHDLSFTAAAAQVTWYLESKVHRPLIYRWMVRNILLEITLVHHLLFLLVLQLRSVPPA